MKLQLSNDSRLYLLPPIHRLKIDSYTVDTVVSGLQVHIISDKFVKVLAFSAIFLLPTLNMRRTFENLKSLAVQNNLFIFYILKF